MKKIKIILTKEIIDGDNVYSIECCKHDGQRHFDHHGQYEGQPAPCNAEIPIVPQGSTIYVSHVDADTYIGLRKMLGKEVPTLDYNLMEQIDLNGSSVSPNKENKTLAYMVGVSTIARKIVPRVGDEPQDITEAIAQLLEFSEMKIIEIGKEEIAKSEAAYKKCCVKAKKSVKLFSVSSTDALDPSRAYEDGFDIVVVYRNHYKSISIYCRPGSVYAYAGKELGGIAFAGHPQACGSPRGVEYSESDAFRVFEELIGTL